MAKLYEVAFHGFLAVEASNEEQAIKRAIRWQESIVKGAGNEDAEAAEEPIVNVLIDMDSANETTLAEFHGR